MEFLRFGSSIPGSYWGCCACDIIQNFKVMPDAKASIQLVAGDGGNPVLQNGQQVFAGPTYKDIFMQRIRFGTFGKNDMPNHAFIAILTSNQLAGAIGKAWLPILKEVGFEFIRTVSNSVYGGQALNKPGVFNDAFQNHILMLVRNIGNGAIKNPYLPPKEWADLPEVVPEAWNLLTSVGESMAVEVQKVQLEIWDKIGPAKLLTEAQVREAGAPVTMAGKRVPEAKPYVKVVTEEAPKEKAAKPASPPKTV